MFVRMFLQGTKMPFSLSLNQFTTLVKTICTTASADTYRISLINRHQMFCVWCASPNLSNKLYKWHWTICWHNSQQQLVLYHNTLSLMIYINVIAWIEARDISSTGDIPLWHIKLLPTAQQSMPGNYPEKILDNCCNKNIHTLVGMSNLVCNYIAKKKTLFIAIPFCTSTKMYPSWSFSCRSYWSTTSSRISFIGRHRYV